MNNKNRKKCEERRNKDGLASNEQNASLPEAHAMNHALLYQFPFDSKAFSQSH